MASLFLDTSHKLTFGILDKDYNWMTYNQTEDKKSSAKIHKLIFQALEDNHLKIEDIDEVFGVAGPGSYTGMRVTEGIIQIFELNKIKAYSFYHFQIPGLLNIKQGIWVSSAFKKEVFFYKWKESGFKQGVVSEENFGSICPSGKGAMECYSSFEDTYSLNCSFTSDLILKHSSSLFKSIKAKNLREEVYYFRPLADEFKVSKAR